MTELRRRSLGRADARASAESPEQSHPPPPTPWILRPFTIWLVFTSVFLFSIAVPYMLLARPSRLVLLSGSISPTDEAAISAGILPVEDVVPPSFTERAVVCMPTVERRAGAVEYVSNAVKSWRLATNGSTAMRRLVVFDMNVPVEVGRLPSWMDAVFGRRGRKRKLPSWLTVLTRESGDVTAPRQFLHGDSEERVKWRSKEALDYAEVLRRCAGLADSAYVIVVQDDVLFTERVNEVADRDEDRRRCTLVGC